MHVPKKVLWSLLVVAALAIPLIDPLWRARIINGIVIVWGFPLLLVVVVLAAAFVVLAKTGKWMIPVVVLIVGIAGIIFYGMWRTYALNVSYADSIVKSQDQIPSFSERAPYQVAQRQATSNLGGINGAVGPTDYLPTGDRYTTLVDRPGLGNPGYAAIISQKIALTGNATGTPCTFNEKAGMRMDGWFLNSLTRAIAAHDTLLIAKNSDAWGYCDGDTPKVVVPMTKLSGWILPKQVPAGVAIYNGSTGELEFKTEVKAGELPGPSIPISHAERLNNSLETFDGTWYSTLMGQSGITDNVKDNDDPNAGNSSNFSLAYSEDRGKGSVYVSPFTSRSSSRSIDYLSVMESGHVVAGQDASITLYKLDHPRQSNAATADKVKSAFSELPGWATGWKVQEIVPVSNDEWAASIGLNQNVNYRVMIKADGTSCLLNSKGETIRCTKTDGQGSDTATPAPETATQVPSGDLTGLSNEQLAQLQDAVTKEVLKRLNQK